MRFDLFSFYLHHLLQIISKDPDFKTLTFSAPNGFKRFHRTCWVLLKDDANPSEANERLKNCKIPMKYAMFQNQLPILRDSLYECHLGIFKHEYREKKASSISSTPSRLRADFINCRNLCMHMSSRSKTDGDSFRQLLTLPSAIDAHSLQDVSIKELKINLDLCLIYLR